MTVSYVVQYAVLLALAPFVQGLVKTFRARMQGRAGPSPLQSYRDLR